MGKEDVRPRTQRHHKRAYNVRLRRRRRRRQRRRQRWRAPTHARAPRATHALELRLCARHAPIENLIGDRRPSPSEEARVSLGELIACEVGDGAPLVSHGLLHLDGVLRAACLSGAEGRHASPRETIVGSLRLLLGLRLLLRVSQPAVTISRYSQPLQPAVTSTSYDCSGCCASDGWRLRSPGSPAESPHLTPSRNGRRTP